MSVPPPSFVLETALYAADLEAAERFYNGVLRLEVLFREEGRHVFFRCGTGVVLLFRAAATREGDSLPPHGADGAGHVAFAVPARQLEEWQAHFEDHDVEVEHDQDWGERGRSLYVRDPAGNSVELATPILWGTASRDDRLRHLRSQSDPPLEEADPVEQFLIETLPPVLDVLGPAHCRIVGERLDWESDWFASRAEADRREGVRRSIEKDERLRHILLGTLLGHLTEEELSTYHAHSAEIRPPFFAGVLARLQNELDASPDQKN